MNYYIIGLPLCGKKYISNLIHNITKFNIININSIIESKYNDILLNIYNKYKYNTYLNIEYDVSNKTIIQSTNKIIILPNTILDNIYFIDKLKLTGHIIYVKEEYNSFFFRFINNNYLLLSQYNNLENIYNEYDILYNNITNNIINNNIINKPKQKDIEDFLNNLDKIT
tara:strand:- start:152 stop:658 length:507 start_codon:yes stop_codon:yes gene_type:complete